MLFIFLQYFGGTCLLLHIVSNLSVDWWTFFPPVVCVGCTTSCQHIWRQGLQGGQVVQLDGQTLASVRQETA